MLEDEERVQYSTRSPEPQDNSRPSLILTTKKCVHIPLILEDGNKPLKLPTGLNLGN